MEVCKEITISTAHMLSGHKGLCANLHGHNYRVCVTLLGKRPSKPTVSSARMLMDFSDLKEITNQVICDKFDHALVFSGKKFRNSAEEELLAWAKKHDMRHLVMPETWRSTAEDMSLYMAMSLMAILPTNVQSVKVTLWETPTSYAVGEAVRP